MAIIIWLASPLQRVRAPLRDEFITTIAFYQPHTSVPTSLIGQRLVCSPTTNQLRTSHRKIYIKSFFSFIFYAIVKCYFTVTSLFAKISQFANTHKRVSRKKLANIYFLLFSLNPRNYEGVVSKRESLAIKVNLSPANAPPPKGYYLFLLADGLGPLSTTGP